MDTQNRHGRRAHGQRGFSLIDLAVIMGVTGILLAGFLATYKVYQAVRAVTVTEENARAVQEALGAFIALGHDRYPVPARFGLVDGDEGFGLEAQPADILDNCTESTSLRKVCRGPASAPGKSVLIGVVPFADLNMPAEQARDGYGRLFTYAVAEDLTQPNGDNTANYQVCVKSQDTDQTGAVTLADCTIANDNAPVAIAIVSHGRDGVGAWLPSGQIYKPCETLAEGSQNENCNFDGVFIRPSYRAPDGTRSDAKTEGDGSEKNDDVVKIEIREDSNFWASATGDKITNRHNYKVGIGTNDPQAALDVNGNVKADKILATNLCLDGSATCLQTNAIAGAKPEMECSALGMVKAVQNNEVVCQYLANPGSCGAAQYVSGFDSNGDPICADLSAACGSAHDQAAASQPTTNLCASGTASAVTGSGPWSWTCTLGADTVNCQTADTSSPGCIDECGETKHVGAKWCGRDSANGYFECKTGSIVNNLGCSGIFHACCDGPTKHCQ